MTTEARQATRLERMRTRSSWPSLSSPPSLAWILVGCVTATVLLRVPYLHLPLNIDEGGDAFIAHHHWFHSYGSIYGHHWLDRPPLLIALYDAALTGGTIGIRVLGLLAAAVVVASTVLLAHLLGGKRAAMLSGALCAAGSASVVVGAEYSNAELLAGACTTASVLLLVGSRFWTRANLSLAGAGFAGICAVMIKQSFIDALLAAFAMFLVSWLLRGDQRFRWSGPAAYFAGVAPPVVAVLVWAHVYSVGIVRFSYAMLGFRIAGLSHVAGSGHRPLQGLLLSGVPTMIGSGIALSLPWAIVFSRRLRASDRVLAWTLFAWIAGAVLGIVGGGNFFPHYFIQLVPVCSALGGLALATEQRRLARVTLWAALAIATLGIVGGVSLKHAAPPQRPVLGIANFIKSGSHPHDTVYVMYARANLLYYSGLASPFPYHWSLMDQVVPRARHQIINYLASPGRPVWVVGWQSSGGVVDDPNVTAQVSAQLHQHYRPIATVCGHSVFLRNDRTLRVAGPPAPHARVVSPGARASARWTKPWSPQALWNISCGEDATSRFASPLRRLGVMPDPDGPTATFFDYFWS